MTTGFSSTHAHAIINVLRNTAYAGINPFVQVHTGDPGAAGTSNASAETTRKAVTFGAPSAGSSTAAAVSWAAWSAGSEAISHCSLWTASTAGTFLHSGALAVTKNVTNGDTLNLTLTTALTAIAA